VSRALKTAAAVAGALILALLIASVLAVVLAVVAWPVVAVNAFGAAREGLGDALGLNPKEERPPWT